jgi:hypothetical protein
MSVERFAPRIPGAFGAVGVVAVPGSTGGSMGGG